MCAKTTIGVLDERPFRSFFEPGELVVAQAAQAVRLEVHHVHQGDEVHAVVVEAVIALVFRGLPEAAEIFRSGTIGHVVFAGHGMQFGDFQAGHQLGRVVEFLGLGEMGDVAGVNRQRRLDGHGVDVVDRLLERGRDVGIGFLVEADMRIADLQEQGDARPADTPFSDAASARFTGASTPPDKTNSVPAPPKARHFNAPRRDGSDGRSDDMVASRLGPRCGFRGVVRQE